MGGARLSACLGPARCLLLIFQKLFRIDGCLAPRPGGGHSLLINAVMNISRRENSLHIGLGAVMDNDVPLIHLQLTLENSGVGLMADGNEHSLNIQGRFLSAFQIL